MRNINEERIEKKITFACLILNSFIFVALIHGKQKKKEKQCPKMKK